MIKFITAILLTALQLTSFGQDLLELTLKDERVAFLDSTNKHHKNAFLFIVSTSCAPCGDMKSRVLADDSVSGLLNGYMHAAQVNVSSELGLFMTQKYQIKSLPSSVVFDRNGQFLTLIRGDVPKRDFLNIINSAVVYEQVMQKLEEPKMSERDMLLSIQTLSYLNKDSAGRVFANQYLAGLTTDNILQEKNELVIRNYISDLEDSKTTFLIKNEKAVEEMFSMSLYDDMVRNMFEYNLSMAIANRDTARLITIQNKVLKEYLDEKVYPEGKSGMWQRYYIGTEQWKLNRKEVLDCYKQVSNERYLLNRAAIVLQKYYQTPEMVDNAIEWLLVAEYVEKTFENQLMLGQLYLIKKDYKNAKKKAKKAKKFAGTRSKLNRVDDLEYSIEIQTEKK